MKTAIILAALALRAINLDAQNQPDTHVGDDYAKAALRAVIAMDRFSVDVDEIVRLDNEADAQASTPAEEASLYTLIRLRPLTVNAANGDKAQQDCFAALKRALKARSGALPAGCVLLPQPKKP
jgi:hypothetical protein